jgi:folate-binding protein YgfZ
MPHYSQSRKVIALQGAEARDFLQDLVSNQVPQPGGAPAYAALLTPQGKYLADFFVLPPETPDGAYLIDCEGTQADDLFKRLRMYRLRRKIDIEMTELAVSRGTGPAPEGGWPDPRDSALGWRHVGPEALPEDDTDWEALHIAQAIPRAGRELGPDSFILEMGFERLHGVDYRKGCFVGQEVVARMKHKTELRKGLARVRIEGDAAPGTEITAGGKPAGVLHSVKDGAGLAYLRFNRANEEMEADGASVTLVAPAIA